MGAMMKFLLAILFLLIPPAARAQPFPGGGTSSQGVVSTFGNSPSVPLYNCLVQNGQCTNITAVQFPVSTGSWSWTGSASGVAMGPLDSQGVYNVVTFSVTSYSSGTYSPQVSNDLTLDNWITPTQPICTRRIDGLAFLNIAGGAPSVICRFGGFRYFRLSVAGWTSGTTTGFYNLSTDTTPISVYAALSAVNGWTPLLANAQGNTPKSIKTSGGVLGMLQCYNPNATPIYVQTYDIASGSVTVGTSTPNLSIPIAATSTGGFALANPGIKFLTAMSMAVTTSATGGTGPGTGADCNVAYN